LSSVHNPLSSHEPEAAKKIYAATVQYNDIAPDADQALAEVSRVNILRQVFHLNLFARPSNDFSRFHQTIASLRALPFELLAVIAGTETGVELGDRLSHRLGLRTNGEELSTARRNKFLMGEAVRAAGLRAVKQKVSQ
jgi:hypothetical protein